MPDTTSNIPDYQSIMLPLLELTGDGATYRLRDAVDLLAQRFALSQAELKEMLPSGYAPLFANRVGWASTYLKKAGLLESEKRGTFQISERGRSMAEKQNSLVGLNSNSELFCFSLPYTFSSAKSSLKVWKERQKK